LIVALGGTAYAATKLPPKSVGPKQIKSGAVTAKKIRPGAVGSDAVLDNSLGGADIDESTLQGVDAATLVGKAPSDLLDEAGNVGRSSSPTSCDDNIHNTPFSPCGSVDIAVPRRARLLLTLSGVADAVTLDDATGPGSGTDSVNGVIGQCFVLLDGSGPLDGIVSDLRTTGDDSFSATSVSDPVDAGTHTVTAGCNELDGDIDFGLVTVTAVTLSAN
jgi:hypothetical protein